MIMQLISNPNHIVVSIEDFGVRTPTSPKCPWSVFIKTNIIHSQHYCQSSQKHSKLQEQQAKHGHGKSETLEHTQADTRNNRNPQNVRLYRPSQYPWGKMLQFVHDAKISILVQTRYNVWEFLCFFHQNPKQIEEQQKVPCLQDIQRHNTPDVLYIKTHTNKKNSVTTVIKQIVQISLLDSGTV